MTILKYYCTNSFITNCLLGIGCKLFPFKIENPCQMFRHNALPLFGLCDFFRQSIMPIYKRLLKYPKLKTYLELEFESLLKEEPIQSTVVLHSKVWLRLLKLAHWISSVFSVAREMIMSLFERLAYPLKYIKEQNILFNLSLP